jgi:hypothetical protein
VNVLFVLFAASAAPSPAHIFPLAPELEEISGLAPAGPDSVFAHGDEYAIIHEVSLRDGAIRRSFAFGKPTVKGDFEAIAESGGRLWLLSSDGRLYEGEPVAHAKRTRYHVFDTGAGTACELEGLAAAESPDSFYLLCKNLLDRPDRRLRIYRWSAADRFAAPILAVDAPLKALLPSEAIADFRPSDLARDPKSGAFIVLSASGALLEVDAKGALVRYAPLDPAIHRQAEGLARLPDGRTVIADEGVRRAGSITVYERN